MKSFLLSSAICASISIFAINHASAATLEGRLVNGSGDGEGQADSVELLDLTQGMTPIATLEDVQGSFRFEDVPDASAAHFLLRVTSQGVTYTEAVGQDSFEKPMEVAVYDATSDRSQVEVSIHDVLFQRNGDHMQTTELLQFNNNSQPPQVISASAQPIRVHLPHEIHGEIEVSVGAGSMPLKLDLIETADPGVFTVDYALKPGATRLVVRYLLAYETETVEWKPMVTYRTEERRVLVSPPDINVEAPGMIESKDQVPDGFVVYAGLALEGGEEWPVRLSGGSPMAVDPHANAQDSGGDVQDVQVRPNRFDASRAWIFGGLALVFLCAIGYAASTASDGGQKQSKDARPARLSRLADRFVSGEIDRSTFESERDKILQGQKASSKKRGAPAKAVS